MDVAPPIAHPPVEPALADTPARWPLRVLIASVLSLRAIDTCWVAYQAAGGGDGVGRWVIGGSSYHPLLMASNLVLWVGGSALLAVVAVLARWTIGRSFALVSGYIAIAWLVMQLALVGVGSWQLPIAFVGSIAGILLSLMLPKRAPEPG